jgi:DNA-binding PadR family transcriptional regulator
MLQGTLDMLVLRTLITGPAHGHTIAHVIEHSSDEVLQVEQGSLYPALHRLQDRGWVSSNWWAQSAECLARRKGKLRSEQYATVTIIPPP